MVRLKVVTGYVPITGHPRTATEYGKLIEQLGQVVKFVPHKLFMQDPKEMWLLREAALWTAKNHPAAIKVAEGDNPEKNTMLYHAVQHQKFVWLAEEAILDPEPETLVWLDAGIMHVPGVTATVILDFLEQIQHNDFAIPGCWHQGKYNPSEDAFPCWRFCGGVVVVPTKAANALLQAIKLNVHTHLDLHRTISWEVNTLARAEAAGIIKPRWYEANHDQTLFTRYRPGTHEPDLSDH